MSLLLEISVLLLVLVVSVSCLALFASIHLLISKIANPLEALKSPFSPQVVSPTLDQHTIDKTSPLEDFTPHPKKPLNVIYEEDVITPEDGN